MTHVDFYLQVNDPVGYACRLLRKAYRADAKVIVFAPTTTLSLLDEELWTFSPLDFIPHAYDAAEKTMVMSPILLTDQLSTEVPHYHCLLNLHETVPPAFARFERLLEIVAKTPQAIEAGRERYRFYRHRGYRLKHYEVNES